MITLYGINNCDTVKKARRWLEENGIDYRFHDFRVDGLTANQVTDWSQQLGWETLVNKRSTTWKQLDETERATMDANSSINAMVEHPTLIKRPVLDNNGELLVGFKPETYQDHFSS
ncbi:ArsC family reductase [Porticoccus sp. W117]|uniref:ArsC family reductase n=1 Tax=Porticoccus sp. W117 TaxID=3054777 RepID=UPI002599C925|nr:ArsC family reductase [Porticoccus sp. W117]MDM3872220.1 ArsC family reductase [Porticoccus sp. W117]